MMPAITPSLGRFSLKMGHVARRAIGIALLCSSSIVGCNVPDPSHHVGDNVVNDVITFNKDQLVGRYLTESTVGFHISRDDMDESEGLSITSSDSSLLRLTSVPDSEPVFDENESCFGAACSQDRDSVMESGQFTQYFEVLAPGSVTLTFRDGDEVVLKREVQLIEASSLEATRNIGEVAPPNVNPIVGRGEKVIVNSAMRLRLNVKAQGKSGEEVLDISTITELPSGEGFDVSQADLGLSKGVNLTITTHQEGALTVPVQVGGQRLDLEFEVVSESDVERVSVTHGRAGEHRDADDRVIPLSTAIAVAEDSAGQPIFGGRVIWSQLDDAGNDTLNVAFGDRIDFEFQEGAQVPFRVTLGDHSEVVYLPMNPDSSVIFQGDAFSPGGCDAKGQAAERAPLIFILLALLALRRRVIA